MPESKLLWWARAAYLVGMVSTVLFLWPAPWFPLALGKVTVFSSFLLLSLVLYIFSGGMRQWVGSSGFAASLLGALLPLTYLSSFFFSSDRSVGISGFSIESDTVLFVVLATLAFLLASGLFRAIPTARMLLWGTASAIAAAAVFQCIVIIFGDGLSFTIFADRSVNLVGKWNDFGLLVGLLILLVLTWATFLTSSTAHRALAGIGAAGLGILLGVVQFSLVWSLLLIFFLPLALIAFAMGRGRGDHSPLEPRPLPWIPVAGALVAAVFLFWGGIFHATLSRAFPVSALEVRPAFSSTVDVIRSAHGNAARLLVGTGPQTFSQQWLLYKPASVNHSRFWDLDFNVGFSTALTTLASAGVLGFVAWMLPFFLLLGALVRTVRSTYVPHRDKVWAVLLGIGALYLWSVILFYVPSQNVILLAFALCGAAFGFSIGRGAAEPLEPGRRLKALLVALVLLALSLWVASTAARRFVMQSYVNQGLVALNQKGPDTALALAARARSIEPAADTLRLSTDAGIVKLEQLAALPAQEDIQKQFTALAQDTITFGQAVVAQSPKDYRAYLSLGRVFDLLASLKVGGAYENARAAYEQAEALNPWGPRIPLLRARLEATQGNRKEVEAQLRRSLTLKPDYTEAILFIVELNVFDKDIPNALIAARAALESDPDNAEIKRIVESLEAGKSPFSQ